MQYLKDWEVHLKSLVDSYPALRFVASGSAAAALRLKSRESGAGRFTDFLLPPLTFREYLALRRESPEGIGALNAAFVDYVNYGGFPEVACSNEVRRGMERYVQQDIIDKVLLRDLPSLHGISDVQDLYRLFVVLALNTAEEVSLDALSRQSGMPRNTLRRYLEFLEAAFLIHRLRRVDADGRDFKRERAFKVYLTNPTMRTALFGPVGADDLAMVHLAETAVVNHVLYSTSGPRWYYARWKRGRTDVEVDLVLRDAARTRVEAALEVKWSDAFMERPELLAGLRELHARHPSATLSVTSRTAAGVLALDDAQVSIGPTSEHVFAQIW